jgi:hypothetical protein
MRGQMSENEKVLWFAFLFPIFWPFIPVLLICMACESIGHRYRKWKWDREARAAPSAGVTDPQTDIAKR